jgi:hypothetical protein
MTYVPRHSEIVAAGRRNNLLHQAWMGFGRADASGQPHCNQLIS